jgi:hypothetical protein
MSCLFINKIITMKDKGSSFARFGGRYSNDATHAAVFEEQPYNRMNKPNLFQPPKNKEYSNQTACL